MRHAMKSSSFFFSVLCIALFTGCTQIDQQNSDGKLSVSASFYPLAFLAEQIGGEFVNVLQVTPDGVEPHDYEPTAKQVAQSMEADLFLFNGGGVDGWAEKLSPELINNDGKALRAMSTIQKNGVSDPHVWLSPRLMKTLVPKIETMMSERDPVHNTEYKINAQLLIEGLEILDADYQGGLKDCSLRTVVVSHNAFRYLARDYHFTTLAISGLSPEEEPSLKKLAEIATIVKEQGIKHIFFETLVSPKLANTLAEEVGATTLVLNPLEGLTPEQRKNNETYFTLMQKNLSNLRTALQCQ